MAQPVGNPPPKPQLKFNSTPKPRNTIPLEQARPFLGRVWVIEGEDVNGYEELLKKVGDALGHLDILDWILTNNVVALIWEMQRCRNLGDSLVRLHRRESMEVLLGKLLTKQEMLNPLTSADEVAAQWAAGDKPTVKKVEALLAKAGLSMTDVDAQTLSDHSQKFEAIDLRLQRCEGRFDNLIQQIERRRVALAKRVREASEELLWNGLETAPTAIESSVKAAE